MIQESIENEKAEQKEKERMKEEQDLIKERKWQRKRALERTRDLERWMQMEKSFKEMKRRMNMEVANLKEELEIERDRYKMAARQAKKRQQCLEKRVRMLEIEIEEMKKNILHVYTSTSNVDVMEGKESVFTENKQEARTKRKTQAEREKEMVEGQRKQQEARDYKYSHFSVDLEEGSWQKMKRRVMAFLSWIWKGLRHVGSAFVWLYEFLGNL